VARAVAVVTTVVAFREWDGHAPDHSPRRAEDAVRRRARKVRRSTMPSGVGARRARAYRTGW
jgi:hypothetical protein